MQLTLSASATARVEAVAYVLGYGAVTTSPMLEQLAADIQSKKLASPQVIRQEKRIIILVALSDKPWLQTGNENWRMLGKTLIDTAQHAGIKSLRIELEAEETAVSALAEGLHLAAYRFDKAWIAKNRPRARETMNRPKN